MAAALRAAFARLGDSAFELEELSFQNDVGGFVPVSRLNQIRRQVLSELQERMHAEKTARLSSLQEEICWAGKGPLAPKKNSVKNGGKKAGL